MGKCKPPSGKDENGEINDSEEFYGPRRGRRFSGRGYGRGYGRGRRFRGGSQD
jgi:hypothetical protein